MEIDLLSTNKQKIIINHTYWIVYISNYYTSTFYLCEDKIKATNF